MKDLVESGKAHNCLNSDDSIKRYPKIFSIALALTFIALVAFAAFLVSDILSLESNSLNAGSFNVFSILNPLESGAATKDLHAANNSSQGNIGILPPSMDGSGVAKRANESSDNAGMNLDSSDLTNSQLSGKSTTINKAAKQAVVISSFSTSSDGDSHRSSKKKKQVSSKSSILGTQGNASPSNAAGENRSGSSQVPNHSNLSDNLTLNLSTSAPKINVTEILSSLSNETNLTGISSSSMPEFNHTPGSFSPAESNSSELSLADNETSNWATEPGFVPGNGVLDESMPPEQNWTNSNPHDSNENFISGSMEDNTSNTTNTTNISDEVTEFDSGSDARSGEVFADPSRMGEEVVPLENEIVDSYSIPSEPGSQVVPGGQPSSQLKDAKGKENKRISNRGKSTKTKSLKKSTPRDRPVRTRQARPARDRSRK